MDLAGGLRAKPPLMGGVVEWFAGAEGVSPVWSLCQAAGVSRPPFLTWIIAFCAAPPVLTRTMSSGEADANTSTPARLEVAETMVVPKWGNRPSPVNMPSASYMGIGVSAE